MNKYIIFKEYETNLTYLMDILGSSTTDNITLNKIGKYLLGNLFIGVFPSDEMPVLKENEMCIINTDNKKGVHWVACYKYRNMIYCYDSFDRNVKTLSQFWSKNKNWVNANKDRDQSYTEENCGSRCVAWLISINKHKTKVINII